MKRILLQGDSITDCGRKRDRFDDLGAGYANLVGCHLRCEHPNEYEVLNRGIGGNRVIDLYGRVRKDIIVLEPDFMSIMIGVNDVWHELEFQNGIPAEKFEILYDMMLDEIKEALPNLQIMILGPYVLNGSATASYYEEFRREVDLRAEAAKRIAEKYALPYVDLQALFDEAEKKAPSSYWLEDGVHPVAAGKELIKRAWLECFYQNWGQAE